MFLYSKLKLKEVELVFENCEYCIIPAKYIHNFSISNFNSVLNYSKLNDLLKFDKCKLNYLEISNDFLLNNFPRFNEKVINNHTNLFDRIKDGKDVASLKVIYKRNIKTPELYLPWNDENEYSNKYQTFEIKEKTSILKVSRGNKDE